MTREASEYVGGFRHQTLLRAPTDSDGQNSQCGNLINTALWSKKGFQNIERTNDPDGKHWSSVVVLLCLAFLHIVLNGYCSFVSL